MHWRSGLVSVALVVGPAGALAQPAPSAPPADEVPPPPSEQPPSEQPPTSEAPPPPPMESAAPGEPLAPPGAEPPPSQPVAAPSVEPAVVATASGYPQAYAARPLVLPTDAFEGSALLSYANYGDNDSMLLAPRARYALAQVELEAGATFILYQQLPDIPGVTYEIERLSNIVLGAHYIVDPDLTIGARLGFGAPLADYSSVSPRVVLASRRHLSPRSAIDFGVETGLDRTTYDTGMGSTSLNSFALIGEVRVIAQATETFALEGRATLGYLNSLDDMNDPLLGSRDDVVTQSFGLRGIVSTSPTLDVVFGVDVPAQEGETISVGVVVRRLP